MRRRVGAGGIPGGRRERASATALMAGENRLGVPSRRRSARTWLGFNGWTGVRHKLSTVCTLTAERNGQNSRVWAARYGW